MSNPDMQPQPESAPFPNGAEMRDDNAPPPEKGLQPGFQPELLPDVSIDTRSAIRSTLLVLRTEQTILSAELRVLSDV